MKAQKVRALMSLLLFIFNLGKDERKFHYEQI